MKKYLTTSLITLATLGLGATVALAQTVTVTSAPYQFTRDMSIGANSDDVKQLQILLNKDADTEVAKEGDGSKGKEISTFGMRTMKAVQVFQKKHKLNPSGFVGPLTRKELNKLVNPSLPGITSISSKLIGEDTITLTAKYDGGGQKPIVWFAYGATPSAMSILSKEVTGDKTVGTAHVTLSGVNGDCFAQAFIKTSVGTTKSETIHCR